MVGSLERIGPKVEELGEAQGYKRVFPNVHTVRSLFGEDHLPLVIAQRHQ